MKKNSLFRKIALMAVLFFITVSAFAGGGRIYYAGGAFTSPYLWAWSDENNVYNAWPGEEMTSLPVKFNGNVVFYADIPDNWTLCPANVMFSNNGSCETNALDIPGFNYLYTDVSWEPYTYPTGAFWSLSGQLGAETGWTDHFMNLSDGVATCTLSLAAGKEYYFKLKYVDGTNESWYSCGSTMTRTTYKNANFTTDADNAAIATTIAGNYVFSFNTSTRELTITYPDALAESEINATAVPAENEAVMIQAYYWAHEGNTATPWTSEFGPIQWTDLNAQASELGKYFNLVWLAPSAATEDYTGFLPNNYSNQNNIWGNVNELKTLISNLHSAGAKVVADIVINHSSPTGTGNYCTWDAFNFGNYGAYNPDATWIAKDDEIFISRNIYDKYYYRFDNDPVNGEPAGIKEDAGECGNVVSDEYDEKTCSNQAKLWSWAEYNCVYSRDWAHKKKEVREMSRAYLTWMKEEIGYDGWRYDFAKGLHGSHLDDYNKASNAAFSVAEVFDGDINREIGVLEDTKFNTYVFDFPGKYNFMNDAIKYGVYEKLKGIWDSKYLNEGENSVKSMLVNYKKNTVTFVDNHDTFRENYNLSGTPNQIGDSAKVVMANAFILSMPGVPCVFYPHWYVFKEALKPMIAARHEMGVHSESIVSDEAYDTWEGDVTQQTHYYKATITGKNGSIRLLLGPNSGYKTCPEGYVPAYVGNNGVHVGVYKTRLGEANMKKVYFLDTQNFGEVNAYVWRGMDLMRKAEWPGEAMTLEGTFNGYKLYSYSYDADLYTNIIFSKAGDDNTKTADLTIHEGECYQFNEGWNDGGWTALTNLSHSLTIGEKNWASLYLPLSVSLPDGLHGYYAAEQDGSTVTLNLLPESTIPAKAGVVVKGAQGTHILTATGAETSDLGNLFSGTKEPTLKSAISAEGVVYVLSLSQSSVAAPVFGAFTSEEAIPASKAYLLVEQAGAPDVIRFVVGEEQQGTGLEMSAEESGVVKMLRDGQLIIIREGVEYNALGQVIK